MTYKEWKGHGVSYCFRWNGINDIFDTNRFPPKFKSFSDLLNMGNERDAAQVAKDVFTDCMRLVAEDMIERNEIFIFPVQGFGYMKISNTANVRRPDYVYDIESDGKIYTPRIKLDPRIRENNKRHYRVRFNKVLRNRMADLILNGHKYS